jgi:hypothetical protein
LSPSGGGFRLTEINISAVLDVCAVPDSREKITVLILSHEYFPGIIQSRDLLKKDSAAFYGFTPDLRYEEM